MKIKRAVRQIRKTSKRSHRGGAIYTFDYKDSIGGQAAVIPLNGTADGDCPASATQDLGFTNYGATRGGSRKKSRKGGKSKNKKSNKLKGKKNHTKKSHTKKRGNYKK